MLGCHLLVEDFIRADEIKEEIRKLTVVIHGHKVSDVANRFAAGLQKLTTPPSRLSVTITTLQVRILWLLSIYHVMCGYSKVSSCNRVVSKKL